VALAALPTNAVTGTALGQFKQPKGIWAVATQAGQHTIYVADTGNSRVQRLDVRLDADGDGMDDVWQDLNGVASGDANGDPDHDNLTNLGEYRMAQAGMATDPHTANATTNLYFYPGGPALPPGTPPGVTNVTAYVTGSVVTITAWYDRSPTNAAPITLALAGGAYLAATTMQLLTPASNACVYTYNVQPGDAGLVDARVAGVFQNPMVYDATGLFAITTGVPFAFQALSLAAPGLDLQQLILTTNETLAINAQFSTAVSAANVVLTNPNTGTLLNDAMNVSGSSATYTYQVPTNPV
jgi:hypothetical protein